jgi:hypothetical protein
MIETMNRLTRAICMYGVMCGVLLTGLFAGGCASDPPEWFKGDGVALLDPFPGADEAKLMISPGVNGPGVAAAPTAEPKSVFADKTRPVAQREDRIRGMLTVRLALTDAQEESVRRMVRSAEIQQRQLSSWYKKNKAAMIEPGWNLYQSMKESIEAVLQGDQHAAFRAYVKERLEDAELIAEAREERMAELRKMRREERARKERELMGLPDATGPVIDFVPGATPATEEPMEEKPEEMPPEPSKTE